MRTRFSDLRREAAEVACGILQLATDPSHPARAGNFLHSLRESAIEQRSINELLKDPQISTLAEQGREHSWPEPENLRAMAKGSLGRTYQRFIDDAGLEPLPPILEDLHWISRRSWQTHDLWHVLLGVPTTVPGEAALSAFRLYQLRDPGTAANTMAWIFNGLLYPEHHHTNLEAIHFGLSLALRCSFPILSLRWEEHWETPVEELRASLLPTEILESSPFAECPETYA